MQLIKIIEILSVTPIGNRSNQEINHLLTDSRMLSFVDGTLFFALVSTKNDGHRYIENLYKRGVRNFVISSYSPLFRKMEDASFLLVEDTLQALQKVALVHRKTVDIPIIGITGSNGKTVVKEWLNQLLYSDYSIIRSPRSYNSQVGVPLSIWKLKKETTLGIFEAGISQKGEMEEIAPIISPTIGIITNIGSAHQAGFEDIQEKCDEKLKLFENTETVIYCSDNHIIANAIREKYGHKKQCVWGTNSQDNVRLTMVKKYENYTLLSIEVLERKQNIRLNFTDDASIQNAMQCVTLMHYLGYSTEVISERIPLLESVAMRLEKKMGVKGCTIINDSYNSDINSLEIALNFQQNQTKNRINNTLILSDILESGKADEELYATVQNLIEQKQVGKFIAIGTKCNQYLSEIAIPKKYFFENTAQFLKSSIISTFENETILLKGARQFYFEDILSFLERTVHETTLDVDVSALIRNYNYFKSKLRPDTKIVSMVKAYGYGSGAVEVANALQKEACDYFAVAVADEGAELREKGITTPIMVMNPEYAAFNTIFRHHLEPEIYSFKLLYDFIATAKKMEITNYPIHLKLDTGMHRLGFQPSEIPSLVDTLKQQNQLTIRSVFSHLAGADEAQFDDFTHKQIVDFQQNAKFIAELFPTTTIYRHILNSAGIERFTDAQMEAVRLGIGLYGISTDEKVQLETVCTLKTVIIQIKKVKRGGTVGYSRKQTMERDSLIGILPIGYADGLDRRLSNGIGEVYVNGKRAKIVGNICMDLVMIDLTAIPAEEGDSVEIFGKNITIQSLAKQLNTIPYEILTSVSRRVKRVYSVD